MAQRPAAEPITVRTDRIDEIDALADAAGRSRDDIVAQAIDVYLDANAWQMERVALGVAAAREGRTESADAVFAGIAARHGWAR